MKVIIIEDEHLVAKELFSSLKKIRPDISIECVLSSVKEAIEYFRENKQPDLIFSDIQLGDGLSFEITKEIEILVPIIFCTAYDEYAIKAFKTNGIEYILNPFHAQSLEKAISKFEGLKNSLAGEMALQYSIAMQALSKYRLKESGTYMVKYRDRFLPVNIDTIAFFYLENEANHLYTHSARSYYVPERMEELEKKFSPVFFRVNRQCLINRNAVLDATEHFPRRLRINLKIPSKTPSLSVKKKEPKYCNGWRPKLNEPGGKASASVLCIQRCLQQECFF